MPTETRPVPASEPPVWTPDGPIEEVANEQADARKADAADAADTADAAADAPQITPIAPLEPVNARTTLAPDLASHPRRRSRAVTYLLAIAAFVMVVGLAFAVGRTTAPAAAAANGGFGGNGANGAPNGQFAPGEGLPGDFGGRDAFGGPSIQGTVQSVDNGVITVKLADGSTVQVTTTTSTTYHTQQAATASDVTAGKTVTVRVAGAPGSTTRTASDVTVAGN